VIDYVREARERLREQAVRRALSATSNHRGRDRRGLLLRVEIAVDEDAPKSSEKCAAL